ncbi:esterase [Arthrobacter phage Galaxy]|uniref:Esterase n=1 Tax=Arthrobacter phage Galaxy TaxID=1772326 RepID=A0A0U4K721_9CAUD|nr:tail spike protein [Arthrobacter phage Galaxy]ALY08867.1 esterase [Arthrobacter phage Galaxy]
MAKLVPLTNLAGIPARLTMGRVSEGTAAAAIIGEPPNQQLELTLPPSSPMTDHAAAVFLRDPASEMFGAVTEAVEKNKRDPFSAMQKWGAALRGQATKPAVWVSVGSSTANGGVASNQGMTWFGRVAALMGKNPVNRLEDVTAAPSSGAWLYNGAVGGTHSGDYMTQVRKDKIALLKPAVVSHMVGSNDWAMGVAPAVYKENVRARLIEIFNSSPSTVNVLIHQQGRWDVTAPAYPWDAYGAALAELAAEYRDRGVVFLNVDAPMRLLGVPQPDFYGVVSSDKMHLNDAGNRILAGIIADFFGIPRPEIPREVYTSGPTKGGSHTTNAEILRFEIPPKPYPRDFVFSSSVYANINSGNGDIGLTVQGEGIPEDTLALRIGSTTPMALSGSGKWRVPAHTKATAIAFAIVYTGSLYTSANAAFTRFVLDGSPA